mgnify:CR=1 FL=1
MMLAPRPARIDRVRLKSRTVGIAAQAAILFTRYRCSLVVHHECANTHHRDAPHGHDRTCDLHSALPSRLVRMPTRRCLLFASSMMFNSTITRSDWQRARRTARSPSMTSQALSTAKQQSSQGTPNAAVFASHGLRVDCCVSYVCRYAICDWPWPSRGGCIAALLLLCSGILAQCGKSSGPTQSSAP